MKPAAEALKVVAAPYVSSLSKRRRNLKCRMHGDHDYELTCNFDSETKGFTYTITCKRCGHSEVFSLPER